MEASRGCGGSAPQQSFQTTCLSLSEHLTADLFLARLFPSLPFYVLLTDVLHLLAWFPLCSDANLDSGTVTSFCNAVPAEHRMQCTQQCGAAPGLRADHLLSISHPGLQEVQPQLHACDFRDSASLWEAHNNAHGG